MEIRSTLTPAQVQAELAKHPQFDVQIGGDQNIESIQLAGGCLVITKAPTPIVSTGDVSFVCTGGTMNMGDRRIVLEPGQKMIIGEHKAAASAGNKEKEKEVQSAVFEKPRSPQWELLKGQFEECIMDQMSALFENKVQAESARDRDAHADWVEAEAIGKAFESMATKPYFDQLPLLTEILLNRLHGFIGEGKESLKSRLGQYALASAANSLVATICFVMRSETKKLGDPDLSDADYRAGAIKTLKKCPNTLMLLNIVERLLPNIKQSFIHPKELNDYWPSGPDSYSRYNQITVAKQLISQWNYFLAVDHADVLINRYIPSRSDERAELYAEKDKYSGFAKEWIPRKLEFGNMIGKPGYSLDRLTKDLFDFAGNSDLRALEGKA